MAGGLRLLARRRIELTFLGIAAVYSFVIPIFHTINLVDGVVLLLIYCGYLWRVAREEREEPELTGVCAYIGCLPARNRRIIVIGMFVAAAAFILASAEPFAESLVADWIPTWASTSSCSSSGWRRWSPSRRS